MALRRSLQDIAFMVREKPYPGAIPAEIRHLHCYLLDAGHSILAVPKPLMDEAREDPVMYETPLPVKFVLAKGWEEIPGTDCICVDVPYDSNLGVMVPPEFQEEF